MLVVGDGGEVRIDPLYQHRRVARLVAARASPLASAASSLGAVFRKHVIVGKHLRIAATTDAPFGRRAAGRSRGRLRRGHSRRQRQARDDQRYPAGPLHNLLPRPKPCIPAECYRLVWRQFQANCRSQCASFVAT